MKPLHYQPEGDPVAHQITAELALEEETRLTFRVWSDEEDIGEVDVELASNQLGFVSGVGPGEKINNGYLGPASLAILACLREKYCLTQDFQFFDFDDQVVN